MVAVVADTDNNRLVIDCLAVSPLGIFGTTLRTVRHNDATGGFFVVEIIFKYLSMTLPFLIVHAIQHEKIRSRFACSRPALTPAR